MDETQEGVHQEPPGGGGGGGAEAEDSFTIGGPRGRDAEAGEYFEPNPVDGDGSDDD